MLIQLVHVYIDCVIYNSSTLLFPFVNNSSPTLQFTTSTTHAQTNAIYYRYHYRSYISPVVTYISTCGWVYIAYITPVSNFDVAVIYDL